MVAIAPAPILELRSAEPCRRLLTVEEFHRMGERGVLCPDERIELLEGGLILMAPIGSYHFFGVNVLARWFILRLDDRAHVGIQGPVRLGPHDEPQPDLTLLRPRADDYADSLPVPEEVLLLIEVSDTTFRFDRKVKLPRYAAAGIPEVWIFNLTRSQVMAYCEPRDGGYAQVRTVRRSETLSPTAFPDLVLPLKEIFRQVKRGRD